jgi:hypothetical protein
MEEKGCSKLSFDEEQGREFRHHGSEVSNNPFMQEQHIDPSN